MKHKLLKKPFNTKYFIRNERITIQKCFHPARFVLSVIILIGLMSSYLPQVKAATNGIITGTIYEDLNSNNQQDINEKGMNAKSIVVYNANTSKQVVAQYDVSKGAFTFSNLPPGTYYLKVEPSGDSKIITGDVGSDGYSGFISVTDGQTTTVRIGLEPYSIINGSICNKQPSQCIRVSGVKVHLLNVNGTEILTTTTVDGYYFFHKVPIGQSYYVHIDQPNNWEYIPGGSGSYGFGLDGNSNYIPVSTNTQIYLSSQLYTTQTVSFKGAVYAGTQVVPDVTIGVYDQYHYKKGTSKTDENGQFLIDNLPADQYYLYLNVPAGYVIENNKDNLFGSDGYSAFYTLPNAEINEINGAVYLKKLTQ